MTVVLACTGWAAYAATALCLLRRYVGRTTSAVCADCGGTGPIHADSEAQRGEPICVECASRGAFAP